MKKNIMTNMECDDGGEIAEFVGRKIDQNKVERTLRVTQPVLLQSFHDEFDKNIGDESPKTPGVPLKALQLGNEPAVDEARKSYYRSGVGKLLHLRRWSRPEMANALRDLTRYNKNCSEAHIEAMHRAMRYATATPNRGLLLAPSGMWDGNPTLHLTYVDTRMRATDPIMTHQ
jgi:glycerophosphoryl diester phosphodiesterase